MKKSALIACVAAFAAGVPAASFADVAFNVGVVSDYRYRGISQSRVKPAIQGGVDYTNGPVYLGMWASSIKWIGASVGSLLTKPMHGSLTLSAVKRGEKPAMR